MPWQRFFRRARSKVPPRRIVRVAKSQPSVAATIAGLALPLNAGMQQVRPQDRDDPANGAPPRT
jgi:hypothetical protein